MAARDKDQKKKFSEINLLIVDDEAVMLRILSKTLTLEGFTRITTVASYKAALSAIRREKFDIALVDINLGKDNGLNLIPHLLSSNANTQIFIVTAYGSIERAIEAIRRGAHDFVCKPFQHNDLLRRMEKAIDQVLLMRRIVSLESHLTNTVPGFLLDSHSPLMIEAIQKAMRAAPTNATLLLRGENGTGKGVLAQFLHEQSSRVNHPFITVNCPTLNEQLLASELFGHRRGSFTGATVDRVGRIEAAEGGTLFLDEISEVSPQVQASLLRFIQERKFERLGENRTRMADVRLVVATNRDLEKAIEQGQFREDLFYRISGYEITLPPLRERLEDLPRLARHFLSFFAKTMARNPVPELSPAAEEALLAYSWPGNVRELQNAMEYALINWPARVIEPEALPAKIFGTKKADKRLGGNYSLAMIEREHILRVLQRARTHEDAARILGINISTLWRKRRAYQLED